MQRWRKRERERRKGTHQLQSYADHHPLKMSHTSFQAIGRVSEGREPVHSGLAKNIYQTVLPERENKRFTIGTWWACFDMRVGAKKKSLTMSPSSSAPSSAVQFPVERYSGKLSGSFPTGNRKVLLKSPKYTYVALGGKWTNN